jgi:hypothetical protein
MKKLLPFLLLLLPVFMQAQEQPTRNHCWDLVKQNAAAFGISADNLKNWRVSDAHYDAHANAIFVYLQQTYRGVDIENRVSAVSFKAGKLMTHHISALKNFVIVKDNPTPSLTPQTALLNAAKALDLHPNAAPVSLINNTENHSQEFGTLGISYNNIQVKLVWANIGNDEARLQLAWDVSISSDVNNALWSVMVDAQNGTIIKKTNLTVYEKSPAPVNRPHNIIVYEDEAPLQKDIAEDKVADIKSINSSKFNVIPQPYENRYYASPTVESDPWTRNHNQNANTLKWNNDSLADYTYLRGNNVYVQDDHDKKDYTYGYSPNSTTAVPNLTFNFTPDFYREPTDTINMKFNFTNLFYWTNLMHDLSYQYGFDEAAGNFQYANLKRGGLGNDFVNEDAQDSSGANNANFSTPVDGKRPRMQMFLFNPSTYKHVEFHSPSDMANETFYSLKDALSNSNSYLQTGPVTANVVYFNDQANGSTHEGCNTAANAADLAGKIAYIDRGTCAFTVKMKNAQLAGAKGVIVGNYSGNDTLVSMGGTDNTVTIPGIFFGGSEADFLKSELDASETVNATLYGPAIDGEIDNSIPTHEYTHGISNRLVGGPQNTSCLNNDEQMGEGWSDWYALMITQNWPASSVAGNHARTVGSYAVGWDTILNYGIRYYPYSTDKSINPWTYDSLAKLPVGTQFDEHTVGEIWCTMLWDLTWKLVGSYGIGNNIFNATQTGGNNIALSLVTAGMKLTTCSPGFVDARDGILKADTTLYGGKYSREIWEAFAARGLGYSASEGSSSSTTDGTAAYDLPEVLPVTFGSFTAQKQNNTALLKWTTALESNSREFVVERSTDGKAFSSIGSVKAAGFSASEKSYSFVDHTPLKGNNVYHIKEVDNDGKATYSDIRSLTFDDLKLTIKISPNPATNIVTISIPGNNQDLQIRLLNNTGSLLNSYNMNGESLSINVSGLARGMYNITIDGKGQTSKYKLLIQ